MKVGNEKATCGFGIAHQSYLIFQVGLISLISPYIEPENNMCKNVGNRVSSWEALRCPFVLNPPEYPKKNRQNKKNSICSAGNVSGSPCDTDMPKTLSVRDGITRYPAYSVRTHTLLALLQHREWKSRYTGAERKSDIARVNNIPRHRLVTKVLPKCLNGGSHGRARRG